MTRPNGLSVSARCAACGQWIITETRRRLSYVVLFDAHDAYPLCAACLDGRQPTAAEHAALWSRCATRPEISTATTDTTDATQEAA